MIHNSNAVDVKGIAKAVLPVPVCAQPIIFFLTNDWLFVVVVALNSLVTALVILLRVINL
jgi:hypothetical protein